MCVHSGILRIVRHSIIILRVENEVKDKKKKKAKPKKKSTRESSKSSATRSMKSKTKIIPPNPVVETPYVAKKFGGVRMTFERVTKSDTCACGKSYYLCAVDWDAKLKIVSFTREDYPNNLQKIRNAESEGLDPYCCRANMTNDSVWTPHRPPGYVDPATRPLRYPIGRDIANFTGGDIGAKELRDKRGNGNGTSASGSGRGRSSKSIRRKR